ncbi:unnamed protein product [Amoebophrya sp. A120]|nr:unnamed protein product [Amoebophrya sp. A120]|eukprot:GSA120T00025129001.1
MAQRVARLAHYLGARGPPLCVSAPRRGCYESAPPHGITLRSTKAQARERDLGQASEAVDRCHGRRKGAGRNLRRRSPAGAALAAAANTSPRRRAAAPG